MLKKIIIILLVIFVLAFSATFYLNKVFIPVKLKARLITFLEEKTGRQIDIQAINYNLIQGVVLENISLSEESSKEEFLKIKKLSFNPQVLPIVLNKKIIIPYVYIDCPQINIIKNADNSWNFSSLLTKKETKTESKFSLVILRINLINSNINFIDRSKTPEFKKTVSNLSLGLYLLPGSANINGNFIIKESDFDTQVFLKTKFIFKNKALDSSILVKNFDVVKYRQYITTQAINPEKLFFENLKVNFSYWLDNKNFSGNIHSNIKEAFLKINELTINSNNLYLEASIEKNNNIFNYNGFCDLTNSSLTNVPIVKNISSLNGKISFSNDKINLQNLSAITDNIPLKISGTITNLKNPNLDILILSAFNLQDIQKKLPENIKSKLEVFTGQANIKLNIKGLASSIISETNGDITISNSNVKISGSNLPLENLSAYIKFRKNAISANIESNILKFNTELTKQDKIIAIPNINLELINSKFNFKDGQIDLTDSKNPNINLVGDINLKLSDLRVFLPKTFEKIDGILSGPVAIKGTLNKLQNLSIQSKLDSEVIKIDDFNFRNLTLVYNQDNGFIKNLGIESLCYMGRITLGLNGEFVKDGINYVGGLEINNIELNEIGKDLKWKDKRISGLLNVRAITSGFSKDPATINGEGIIVILDGYLGEINIFKGLFSVLSVTNAESIIFRNGGCNFQIKDKALYTNNLQLLSEQMDLLAQGSLGFNGSLDFTVTNNLKQLPVASPATGQIGQIISAIATTATSALSARITGTLKQPKFKVQANPTEIIKNIPSFFR